MRRFAILITMAMAALGCDTSDAPTEFDIDSRLRGTFEVEVLVESDLTGAATLVVDVLGGPAEHRAYGWTRERLIASPGDTLTLTVPCESRSYPYEIRAEVVGAYADAPESLGDVLSPAPDGALEGMTEPVVNGDLRCVAGLAVPTELTLSFATLSVTRPAEQGFFDVAMGLDGGTLKDAVWDLAVRLDDPEYPTVWEQRARSTDYGDGAGNASYTGPCFADDGQRVNHIEVTFIGAYEKTFATPQWWGFGDDVPDEPVEVWTPPTLRRDVTCILNQAVFVEFHLTLAGAARDDDGLHAEIAGLRCDAGWSCGADGERDAMNLTCRADGQAAPRLFTSDAVLRCDDEVVARLDPTAGDVGAVVGEDGAHATWRFAPELASRIPAGETCALELRAIAVPDDEAYRYPPLPADGTVFAGDSYPVFTWDIPVSDADGPVCADAALDLTGPVTIVYTAADATEHTRFTHASPVVHGD